MNRLVLVIFIVFISGCESSYIVEQKHRCYENNINQNACDQSSSQKKLLLFFDGTQNTPDDRTNVHELYRLIYSQNRDDLHLLYIAGVGTETNRLLSGSIFGNGMEERLADAYRFTIDNYLGNKNEIFLFGFSRGAYNARIFAGLLHLAGIPDITGLSRDATDDLIENIIDIYSSTDDVSVKKQKITNLDEYVRKHDGVRVRYAGLWDTVKATGIAYKNEERLNEVSDRYFDQICNIDRVAHALSIDDNRGKLFTPKLMTVPSITSLCGFTFAAQSDENGDYISQVVNEVWFAGAHSDVGGGYGGSPLDKELLSGLSMNWMLRDMESNSIDLLPKGTRVKETIEGDSNIGEESILFGWFYRNWNRNLPLYMQQVHPELNLFKFHSSFIARLRVVPRTYREFAIAKHKNSKTENFDRCFNKIPLTDQALKDDRTKSDVTLELKEGLADDSCFQIEEPELYGRDK